MVQSTATSPNVTTAFFNETNALIDAGMGRLWWNLLRRLRCRRRDLGGHRTGSSPNNKIASKDVSIDSNTAAATRTRARSRFDWN